MIKKGGMHLRNSPDIPVLHQLLSKAVQKPGEKQHCNWRHSDGLPLFLEVINPLKERYVQWQLFCDKSGKRTMLFECTGHDILMVFNQISAAINNLHVSVGHPEESSRVLRARQARAKLAADAPTTATISGADIEDTVVSFDDQGHAVDQSVTQAAQQASQDTVRGGQAAEDYGANFKTVETPRIALPKPILNEPAREDRTVEMKKPNLPPPSVTDGKPSSATSSSASPGRESAATEFERARADRAKSKKNGSSDKAGRVADKPSNKSPEKSVSEDVNVETASGGVAEPEETHYPLHGDFREIAPLQLLQLLKSEQVTCRLRIDTADSAAVLYLLDGTAVQAIVGDRKGDDALLQILQWKEGSFALTAGMRASGSNITSSPEDLLLKQEKVEALLVRLSAAGLTEESYFIRVNSGLSRDQFYQRITPQAPVSPDLLAELYMVFDGQTTLADLGELTELRDIELLQAIDHLVRLNLVAFTASPAMPRPSAQSATQPQATQPPTSPLTPPQLPTPPISTPQSAIPQFPTPPPPVAQTQQIQSISQPMPTIHEPGLSAAFEPGMAAGLPQPVKPAFDAHSFNAPAIGQLEVGSTFVPAPTRVVRQPDGKPIIQPKSIDGNMIHSVMMSLRRQDTGLFIYPAFLYFLEEEFFRIFRSKGSLTLILFELCEIMPTANGLVRRDLPPSAIADAASRIARVKRHTDLIGHYEDHDYAILLPGTAAGGAKVFVNKVIRALTASALDGAQNLRPILAFGSASIPEDYTNLNGLLAASELALGQSRDSGKMYTAYREI